MIRKFSAVTAIVAVLAFGTWFFGASAGRPELDTRGNQEAAEGSDTSSAKEVDLGWNRFRGPNGSGVSDDTNIPTKWSEKENLLWKTALPGWGASSPILTRDHVFLTTYSGYGLDARKPGNINELKRQLVCVERKSGKIAWTREFASTAAEDPYRGMGVPEHGYATNTPVTDGKHVFAFFGKSGVVAFDMQGKELWKAEVGTGSSNRRWGSAASLILVDNLVIVNAAEESQTLFALESTTGKVAWKSEAASLELCFSTPAIRELGNSCREILIAVPGEIWALNPKNGKLAWFVETSLTGNLSPSILIDGKRAFAFGGYRSSGSVAIDLSGEKKVSNENVLWTSRATSYVSTPVLLNERFHWIDDKGIYHSSDAKTGELFFKSRVKGITGGGRPVYALPVAINGLIYAQTRNNGLFVVEPADELKVVAQNEFAGDKSVFNATPAVDKGQLFLRSDRFLYCIGSKTQ